MNEASAFSHFTPSITAKSYSSTTYVSSRLGQSITACQTCVLTLKCRWLPIWTVLRYFMATHASHTITISFTRPSRGATLVYPYLIRCWEADCALKDGAFAVVEFQVGYNSRWTHERVMPARHRRLPRVDHVTALFILLNAESSSQLVTNLSKSQTTV
jgi:hypothetical protein